MRRFKYPLSSAALACLAPLAWGQSPAAPSAPPAPGGPSSTAAPAPITFTTEAPLTPESATATAPAPEDVAAKAMAAMDALNATAPDSPTAADAEAAPDARKETDPDKTKSSDASSKSSKTQKSPKPEKPGKPDKSSAKKSKPGTADSAAAGSATATQDDSDNDDTSGPGPGGPTIIPPAAEGGRGMDMMSRSRMDMMVPPGRSHRGVHYPMYRAVEGERGEIDPNLGTVGPVTAPLESLFESEIVTRLDNDHIQFDRAKWVQFDEAVSADGTAKPSMSLEIERGVYDMKNDILMTNQPVRIENKQFLIEGDTMLHDRASGLTRLTGRVRMTFYNQDPEPPAAAAAPSPPTPADAPAAPAKP